MIVKTSKNILLADDSVFFRTKLSAILMEAGHRVRFAADGKEVIKEIQIDSKGIDLLVLDIQMPEVDGFGVLDWINNNGFKGKFPVLAVTGVYDVSEIFDRLKGMGASGLMTKGFTPEQVVFRVNKLLFPQTSAERGEERVPISLPVDFGVGDIDYTGFLLNLSANGLFLHTRIELLPGAMVALKFSLPGIERIISVKGMVKWAIPQNSSRTLFGGVGIEFTSILSEDREVVKSFVKAELKKIGILEEV
ncbi:MAG: response regulator [Thermodesulfobacteriota bacterium]